jgi:PAS domain S-box-containing protein
LRKIFSDDIINISDLSEVPEEAENEKEFLKKQDVKSVLILPVKVSDKLFGFLSFNHIDETREWNDEDIALLIFSVRILGALFERKDILDSLVESEMRYHLLVDSLDDYIYVVDNNMDVILTNEKFDELLIKIGVEMEPQKRNIVNVFPSIPDEVIEHYKNVFKTGEMVLTEESRDIGNKQIWLETRKIPVINEKGEVFQVITVMRDITRFIND